MYDIYDGVYKITSDPISFNFLFQVLRSVYLPYEICIMKPGDCIEIEKYKIVKVL